MKIKHIFFDFDGVIADSVSAKTDAFEEMYLSYGEEIAKKVVAYHKLHGGVSRYEKFRYFHREFLNQEISEAKVNELAERFSDLVLDKVIHADEILGAKSFLQKYHKHLQFWVITGTPTKEIVTIVEERNLTPFFIELHGSPEKKKYWTEFLIEKNNLKREEIIFLGDATTDYEAAKFSKLHFALCENEENKELFSEYHGIRFKDFYEFEEKIKAYI